MSEPINHHFVPEVYLKRFSFDDKGNLYTLDVKSKYDTYVRSNHAAKICYGKNRYKFDNEEIIKMKNVVDLNVIEKFCFKYEDSELSQLFDKIDRQEKFTQNEFRRITQIIVDIKSRNPSFSQNFSNINLDLVSKSDEVVKVKDEAFSVCEDLQFDPKVIDDTEDVLLEKFNDKNYSYNVYLNSFIKESRAKNDVVEQLINWSAIVFSTDEKCPIVSSDNPGFSIDENDIIRNTSFSLADAFLFPISPTSILCYKRKSKKDGVAKNKNILYQKTSHESIRMLNNGAAKLCNKLVYGNSKKELNLLK